MKEDPRQRVSASFETQGLMATLGARLLHAGDGEVTIELPFAQGLSQQHGYVHAGAIAAVADSACGYAALTKAPAGAEVVTAEFKINLLRPALGRRFVATGRVLHAGRSLSVCQGEVLAFESADPADPAPGKPVALIQATIVRVPPRAPA